MGKKSRFLLLVIILAVSAAGCRQKPQNMFKDEIDSIGISWVPDLREGIFEVQLNPVGSGHVLKGETTVPEAKKAITDFLIEKGLKYYDSLTLLPDTSAFDKVWGLVNVSVCNIRFYSSFESEMVSQALMGTPVRILKQDNGWFLIQTPDKYLGWVDSDAIEPESNSDYCTWKSSSRLFYTGKTGDVFSDTDGEKVISDIVAGCIVEKTGEQHGLYEVLLPDRRKGFIPLGRAIPLEKLSATDLCKPGNLIMTAESFTGIPYLWGGTSVKGFDCSGFVKTVYYLNGLILSRDASQQFRHGIRIRRSSFPDSLMKGDLLFFGTVRNRMPRPTHVGIYMGDTEFIHSSGMVKINSLDSARTNFSRFRHDSFIGVRRIIGAKYDSGIQPVLEHSWYR